MVFAALLAAAICAPCALAAKDEFNAQCWLDAAGFSVNCIDGVWGAKSQRAKELYEQSYGSLPDKPFPLKTETVTRLDENELVSIPAKPEDKAGLEYFGYESLKEMFAERGHVSQRGLEKLNPEIADWTQVHAGDKIRIPDFAAAGVKTGGKATLLRVSLKRCEIIAYDGEGKVIAFFPCSIAASKQNLPPEGELSIVSRVENPNYTYTPDFVPAGEKPRRHIFEPGPNNPVGIAWIGLDLPGYGIHGTPVPERVGNAESHGCFRLANWNALKLYRMTGFDTKVVIDP